MKPAILSFAAGLFLAVPALVGCAGEDAEAGEAAYPPVGYTPPPATVTAPAPNTPPPPVQGQAPQEEAPNGEAASGPWQWAPPADDGDGSGDASEAPADGGYADTDPSALSDFRTTLDPYGTWTDDPTYGTVWVPSPSVVGSDFTPYVSAGHWVYDNDYAWVSDYDWGWAPFHYGRWTYGTGYGWEWIPGRQYAGAWVSWRYGVDDWSYVGWAPLAPTWCWHGGVAVGIGFIPRAPYTFVGTGELFAPSIGGRVVAGPQVGVIASHTRPYVPATPAVGGRVAARPAVGGPSPNDLHIAPESVARSTVDNRGLVQARAYARPTTAVSLGARAPATVAVRAAPAAFARGGSPVASYRLQGQPAESHFGGRRLGGGFAGSAAMAPPMRAYPSSPSYSPPSGAVGARPYFGPSPSASYGAGAAFRSPSPGFRPYSPPSAMRSAPGGAAFHSAPAAGGFRPSPGVSSFRPSPGVASVHTGGAASAVHAGGGFHPSSGGGGRAGGHR
jgi:hypothetical protein